MVVSEFRIAENDTYRPYEVDVDGGSSDNISRHRNFVLMPSQVVRTGAAVKEFLLVNFLSASHMNISVRSIISS